MRPLARVQDIRTLSTVVVIAVLSVAAVAVRAQVSLEYEVKAALLLNFARYIEWPDGAFADSQSPIQVCVFASNPFGTALDRVLQGERINDRPLATRLVSTPADSRGCHLLFVPAGAEPRAVDLLRQRETHAVTVGESNRFASMGGAVNLVLEGGRVRFNVNLEPVEARGIRISARMLQLASRVDRVTEK